MGLWLSFANSGDGPGDRQMTSSRRQRLPIIARLRGGNWSWGTPWKLNPRPPKVLTIRAEAWDSLPPWGGQEQ